MSDISRTPRWSADTLRQWRDSNKGILLTRINYSYILADEADEAMGKGDFSINDPIPEDWDGSCPRDTSDDDVYFKVFESFVKINRTVATVVFKAWPSRGLEELRNGDPDAVQTAYTAAVIEVAQTIVVNRKQLEFGFNEDDDFVHVNARLLQAQTVGLLEVEGGE